MSLILWGVMDGNGEVNIYYVKFEICINHRLTSVVFFARRDCTSLMISWHMVHSSARGSELEDNTFGSSWWMSLAELRDKIGGLEQKPNPRQRASGS